MAKEGIIQDKAAVASKSIDEINESCAILLAELDLLIITRRELLDNRLQNRQLRHAEIGRLDKHVTMILAAEEVAKQADAVWKANKESKNLAEAQILEDVLKNVLEIIKAVKIFKLNPVISFNGSVEEKKTFDEDSKTLRSYEQSLVEVQEKVSPIWQALSLAMKMLAAIVSALVVVPVIPHAVSEKGNSLGLIDQGLFSRRRLVNEMEALHESAKAASISEEEDSSSIETDEDDELDLEDEEGYGFGLV